MIKWDRSRGAPEPIRALNFVPEQENGEPLVHIPDFAPSIRLPRPQTIPYCRETVALMAEQAALHLPSGVHLAVTDAWRPVERQQKIYQWMSKCALEAFPALSYASLRRKVNRWVAPFDQKAPPGHSTGAALDVMLVDDDGEPLDVTSPFERFEASPTYAYGLSEKAEKNRMLLVETMLGVGFSNCRDEWWHYSYGDAGWAVRLGKPFCIYGRADLPLDLYEERNKIWEEALESRPNPFLPSST